MKKLFLMAAALLCQGILTAQTPASGMDTIFARNPTYLYTRGWADPFDSVQPPPFLRETPIVSFGSFAWAASINVGLEEAMKYDVDTTRKIIGAAVSLILNPSRWGIGRVWADTNLANWIEYLKIYLHVNDSMVMMREKAFNVLDTSRWMYSYWGETTPYAMPGQDRTRYFPTYEVYYDNSLEVYDSFYLALTRRSSCLGDSVYNPELGHNQFIYEQPPYCLYNLSYYDTSLSHMTYAEHDSLYRIDMAVLYPYHYVTPGWAFYPNINSWSGPDEVDLKVVEIVRPFLFPIIDTTGMGLHAGTPCRKVAGLRVSSTWGRSALFTWEGDEYHNRYELAVGKAEWDPGMYITYHTSATNKIIDYLDSTTLYAARIRAECTPKGNYGEWSDTIHFALSQPQSIASAAEHYTYLLPNPAREWVQVMSSYGLRSITIFDLGGREVLRSPAQGVAMAVDVSALAEGNYMMVVNTGGGPAVKKLTIAR